MSKILIKRSAVPSKVPAITDVDLGELAINTHDGKLYLKKSVSGTETIVEIGKEAASATVAEKLLIGRTINMVGDVSWSSAAFDGTSSVSGVATLATVNTNTGTFGSATAVPVFTVNAKGLITNVQTAALGSMANQNATAISVTGGTINGTSIGANVQSTGSFTILSASSNAFVGGDLSVTGNLIIQGDTTTVNATTMTVEDPIVTLGGMANGSLPTTNDGKDRGIAFQWHNGTSGKVGFFGFDSSTGKFTFVPDATITNETVSGAIGYIDANINGTSTSVSGTVSLANGGTGATTAEGACDNLGAPRINPATPKAGDVQVASGIISIHDGTAWRQVFPPAYQ